VNIIRSPGRIYTFQHLIFFTKMRDESQIISKIVIRPTERHRLCRMAATPYPAYGVVSLVPDVGYALSGLRSGIGCRPDKRSAIRQSNAKMSKEAKNERDPR
ncbi:hypothetical protein B5P53_23840, partial [Citrobacter portucalensis]